MKNPRGRYLTGLMMIAMLLFASGSWGNPAMPKWHDQSVITHSPPQQMVVAIVDNPIYQVFDEPAIVSYQIARGVSVPQRGLMLKAENNNESTTSRALCQGTLKLSQRNGDVEKSQALENSQYGNLPATKAKENQLRGVNTRLDIGELSITL